MTALKIAALLLCLAVPAFAQESQKWQSGGPVGLAKNTEDVPIGAPYRTGDVGDQFNVPLRDYMSSRVDTLESQFLRLLDERDRQYAQRFDAQQKALADALQASKETGAKELQATKEQASNALAASEKAINKAEEANNKRFEGVNEFRQTLSDQAEKFVTKDTAMAKFEGLDKNIKTIEEKLAAIVSRLDNIAAVKEGANSLWGYIAGAVGLLFVIAAFGLNAMNRYRPTPRD